jgi:hypothetical protein
MHCVAALNLSALLLILLALAGCTPADSSAGGDEPWTQPEGEFVKPPPSSERRDIFEDGIDAEDMPVQRGILSTSQGRPHMHSTELQTAHWLFQDEYFVLDARHGLFGYEETRTMTMVVLIDFEPRPFRLVPVDAPDGYPSMEDVHSFSGPYATEASYELVPGKPFNYTLVIPPDSFGGTGAHDLRIVHLQQFAPSGEARPKIDSLVKSRAMTVYYGGAEFDSGPPHSPDAPLVPIPNETIRHYLFSLHGVFLAPPEHLSDLDQLGHPSEARLAGVLETTDSQISVTGYAWGSNYPSEAGQNYYLLFDNETPLTQQAHITTTEPQPSDVETDEPVVRQLDFEINLDDEKLRSLVLVQFPSPFERMDHLRSPIAASINSQVLFLQRTHPDVE